MRGLQALIAYWDGRPVDAVRLADSGSSITPESGTAQIRLESIKARAYGQLNRGSDALAALSVADRLRDHLIEGDELPGGMMAFPVEKQLFYSSSTHLWLAGTQHLSDAEARADEAVEMFQSAPPERQRLGEMSLARMDLAMARLGRGDIDGAATQIHAVLGVSARRRTESVDRRIGHFSRQLALHPGAGSPAAIGLREVIIAHQGTYARSAPARRQPVTTVTLLRPGAMGAAVAAQAVKAGHEVLWVPEGRSESTYQRAKQAGATACDSLGEALERSEIVLSICPPQAAEDVAPTVAPHPDAGGYVGGHPDNPPRQQPKSRGGHGGR
ncbi:NAD(P)-binding domain-containing protein, partial [Streptomyces goshikiensis]